MKLQYSKGKMSAMAGMAFLLGIMLCFGPPKALMFGIVCLAAGAALIYRIMSNPVAAEIVDGAVIFYKGFAGFRSESMQISQISDIFIRTMTINFIFKQRFLRLKATANPDDGFFARLLGGRTMELPMSIVAGGRKAVMDFAAVLEAIREDPAVAHVLTSRSTAPAARPEQRRPDRAAPQPFNPDAALARYMKDRGSSLEGPPAMAHAAGGPARGFGRKGL